MLQVNQYGAGGHYVLHMDFMALYRNVVSIKRAYICILLSKHATNRSQVIVVYLQCSPSLVC